MILSRELEEPGRIFDEKLSPQRRIRHVERDQIDDLAGSAFFPCLESAKALLDDQCERHRIEEV
jgi:hypothetical protein